MIRSRMVRAGSVAGLVFCFVLGLLGAIQLVYDPAAVIDSLLVNLRVLIDSRMQTVASNDNGIGSNCRFARECEDWVCVRWGSPGNGGTAVCLEYKCQSWVTRFV